MKQNEFIVSAADAAFYVDGVLAFTAVANLNSTFDITLQEKNINAGKGSQLIFSYKYGREIKGSVEAADWKLEYLAANVGQTISQSLTDYYKIRECVTLTAGVGTIAENAIGKVAVELPSGSIVEVTPTVKSIDLTAQGLTTESVKVTYKYSTTTKNIVIDGATSSLVGKLVLKADKFNSDKGKIGEIEIEIPAYKLDGNASLAFTPDGVVSMKLDGRALIVNGDTCTDGTGVYAYVREKDITTTVDISDIVATPSNVAITGTGTRTLTVLGLKGGLYKPILIDNADCSFTSDTTAKATVGLHTGVITGVAAGTALITVTYGSYTDVVKVTVS